MGLKQNSKFLFYRSKITSSDENQPVCFIYPIIINFRHLVHQFREVLKITIEYCISLTMLEAVY